VDFFARKNKTNNFNGNFKKSGKEREIEKWDGRESVRWHNMKLKNK
jgi:hypothetical protein